MTWTLHRSEQSTDDLASIWEYIAADNPAAADALVTELLTLFERTRDFPHIGRAADEIEGGLRILTRGSYLLIYEVRETAREVTLIRVLHGARDWPRLFDA